MLETLYSVPRSILVEVVYQVGLRLYVRARFPLTGEAEEIAEAAANPKAIDLETASVEEVVTGLLGEIQRAEAKPLAELSDEEAGKYIVRMNEIVNERTEPATPEQIRRAEATLEEMRRDYGGYSRKVA
ncbi:MAG TPA: hypothetical protein VF746_12385 [Longimicrobium sp.]|jgi:hypothetical protein